MDLILCHTTADFDCLGAAVGLTRLKPGAKLVLTGGSHPTVRDFLALHRDEYAPIERRAVNPKLIRSLSVVDTQQRDRLGKAAEWLDLPQLSAVEVYDHHRSVLGDIQATYTQIESVGATTTLIVEQLQLKQISLTPAEATVMALGIHVDTGSLTFESSTARDALALAWLMQQGASQGAIADYVSPSLSGQLQELLTVALENLQVETVSGHQVASVLLCTDGFVPGLSSLATRLLELTNADALLLGCRYRAKSSGEERLSAIGRSGISGTDLNEIFGPLGGGGHAQAASVTWRGEDPQTIFAQLLDRLKAQIPQPLTARELMSSPVRTILPQTTIREASRILLRYGHSGLFVVDAIGQLVGIISRRDIDLALHHGFSHAPVKGYMTKNLKTITPDTGLRAIESLMMTYDIGRLPVLQAGQLVGSVTRTDVLRQLHTEHIQAKPTAKSRSVAIASEAIPLQTCLLPELRSRLTPQLWHLLKMAANAAVSRGWHLYLVGGAVRDLLLADTDNLVMLQDIDLVVDGFHRSADAGAGVELAKELQQLYPGARLQVHGRFQTAALLWHKDPELDNLWLDIATARTEFYPYPAANPEVEASSIRQDLYRRDFTINALALRLTPPRAGELLDFFGGLLDLDAKLIRVLHANSFIEDPTRIYRAVRFAVRLGFEIESQTEAYIHYAIESGVYNRSVAENSRAPALETRLKNELKYILQAPYWKLALQILGDLGALRCIHPTLELNEQLWKQMRLVDRCLRRFSKLNPQLPSWEMLLEVLITQILPEERGKVATNLQLPAQTIERLSQLDKVASVVLEKLPECQRPSQILQLLQPYDVATLILIAVGSPRSVRQKIWRYLTEFAQVKSPLNGNDLKQLGYQRGPQFKQMLDALLVAKLDGLVGDRASAEAYLAEHFPLK
ncbi:MAG: CBS domain-containing protein [Hormoscilla sp.]